MLVSANVDERIVTAGGATSWTDLVLYLIGRYAGPEEARRLAKIQLFDWHHDGQNPYARLTTRPQSATLTTRGTRTRRVFGSTRTSTKCAM